MKKIILLPIVLIFVLSISCKKSEKELENEYILTVVDKVPMSKTTKCLIILPGLGCHGCIQEGEVFMRDNIKNTDFYFVLTKFESLKILQNKIGVKFKEHSNIYIDAKEGISIPTNNSVYPCVVYIENGEVKSHEFQAPGSNAFDNLKKRFHLEEQL